MTGNPRLVVLLALPALFAWAARAQDAPAASGANCTFQASPDSFLSAQSRVRESVFSRTRKLNRALADAAPAAAVSAITRRSFIDDEIFNKLIASKVAPAKLSTDEEFLRRIYLDLTGRIPSPDAVRTFLADTDASKRDAIIDKLLNSDAFSDKWTMWLGDLMQNATTQVTANAQRRVQGRNAFYKSIYFSVTGWKPLRDIAYEAITYSGNNYDEDRAAANFIMGGSVTGGPAQDTYDGMLVRSATAFLGMAHYDCVNCHNGRGHLDQISLWGSQTTRQQAEQMSAFFSRTRLTGYPSPTPPPGQTSSDPYYQSTVVENIATTAGYDLNTNYGNRPNRVPYNGQKTQTLTPVYQYSGATPKDGFWRDSFAEYMVNDPMFARNMANRLWKQMFNLGLVDPVDTLDPARLDPSAPPPAPWELQATHPVLLEKLAKALNQSNFDLRAFLKLLAQSSAYQLSSRYDGEWNVQDVPLFARHYPRRLEGEEIHDAISDATGVFNKYTVEGWGGTVQYAMQLPEPVEPRSNGAVANFMNVFLRGNRDTTQRNQASSILQQLNLMNDPFVTGRTQVAKSPALLAISKIADNGAAVDEIFLTFLSRRPSAYERSHALSYLQKATSAAARNTVIEDLSWASINKLDFLFSY
ncbi:MAG: DUF1549 and DUF1553 domain-containing protein [Acidobacteriota bacterium]|nr:DUF1549 and DUF1553 domain-containing protein [Acidobacteriota bacterium]